MTREPPQAAPESRTVTASAPGKVLWAGEYAVLEGAVAVVTAVDRRVIARLAPAPQRLSPFTEAARREISARYGADATEAGAAARVVVDSSALSIGGQKLGLGSSAAATVAAVAAALGPEHHRAEVHDLAHLAHAAAQEPRGTRGSGADVAASVWGGALRVQRRDERAPLAVAPLRWPGDLSLALLWTGRPADTAALVVRVRALRERDPSEHGRAMASLAAAADAVADGFARGDAAAVVAGVAQGADAVAELGARSGAPLVPPGFAAVAALARAHRGAAKPTGAGGGDLLLAAFPSASAAADFRAAAGLAGMTLVDAAVDPEGVRLADGPA